MGMAAVGARLASGTNIIGGRGRRSVTPEQELNLGLASKKLFEERFPALPSAIAALTSFLGEDGINILVSYYAVLARIERARETIEERNRTPPEAA